jgi:hypothetical protein
MTSKFHRIIRHYTAEGRTLQTTAKRILHHAQVADVIFGSYIIRETFLTTRVSALLPVRRDLVYVVSTVVLAGSRLALKQTPPWRPLEETYANFSPSLATSRDESS